MKANLRQLAALEEATYNSEVAKELNLKELECQHTNPVWREKVTQWCYDVVDHLKESRSVVYVAMNMLDRFNAKNMPDTEVSGKNFELASLSALFLAVRIAGSGNLSLSQLIGMSRSAVAAKDIIEMGTRMIKTLSWNYRFVTPLEFVRAMCDEFPPSIDEKTRQDILDSASYFVEISVCDVVLSSKRASTTALAAVLNALNEKRSLELAFFNQAVKNITKFVPESRETMQTRIQLRQLFNESCESRQIASPHLIVDDDSTALPTCVSEESLASLPHEENENSSESKRKAVAADYEHMPLKRCKREIIQS
eukprot:scaffold5337_cov167-Amphora_coffeaeformis.AAC.4